MQNACYPYTLEDLQSQTEEEEGDEEAKTYDSFACFRKDTTQEMSEATQNDQTEIDTQSATAEEKDTLLWRRASVA